MGEKKKEIEEKENELRVKEEELKQKERKKRNWGKRERVKRKRRKFKTKGKRNQKHHNGGQTGGWPAPTYGQAARPLGWLHSFRNTKWII